MAAAAVLKRPRSESTGTASNTEIIEISDDESPPPTKRPKSHTPHDTDGPQILAKLTDTNPSTSRATSSSSIVKNVLNKSQVTDDSLSRPTHKKSPFKNIPQWTTVIPRIPSPKGKARRPTSRSITPAYGELAINGHVSNRRSPRRSTAPEDVTTNSNATAQGLITRSSLSSSVVPDRRNPSPGVVEAVPFSRSPRSSPTGNRTQKEETQVIEVPSDECSEDEKLDARSKPTFSIEIPVRPSPSEPRQKLYQTPCTPNSSQIEVVIPSPDFLSRFRKSPDGANLRAERRELLEALKRSTIPAKERPEDVERLFGPNGFSKMFIADLDEERMKSAAPIKKKNVNRQKVHLNWGDHPNTTISGKSHFLHPKQQVKEVLTARFQDQCDPLLTFANNINDRRLNGKFQFVDRYILRAGVRAADEASNHGCNCPGQCLSLHCACLRKEVKHDLDNDVHTKQIRTYTLNDTNLVVLSGEYLDNELKPDARHFEISECNEFCGCGNECWNRVVSKGRTVPLEIFETASCGFGVRSSKKIAKGQFIELYLGEIITQQELERREDAKEENASSYIYSLDWFNSQNCHHVDGENFGTAMRFVNHSCSPNARSFTVQTHKTDKHVYYLAFFAIREIPAGTEITIDYSPQEEGNIVELSSDEEDGRALCHCGAPNCRRVLWRDAGRKRRRRKTTNHG